jgi:hypothetical protein
MNAVHGSASCRWDFADATGGAREDIWTTPADRLAFERCAEKFVRAALPRR